jgi:hypothetical protein
MECRARTLALRACADRHRLTCLLPADVFFLLDVPKYHLCQQGLSDHGESASGVTLQQDVSGV